MQNACKEHTGSWRASRNISIYGNYRIYRADYGVAAAEDPAAATTGPNRNDQFRRRDGIISVFQRCSHVSGYGPGDQQHIGMLR